MEALSYSPYQGAGFDLSEHLQRVRSSLPPDLIPNEVVSEIQASLAGRVPPFCTSVWELRLNSREKAVDLSVKVPPGQALENEDIALPKAFRKEWSRLDSPFFRDLIYMAGLEFDTANRATVPAVFLGICDLPHSASLDAILSSARLLDLAPDSAIERSLRRCLEALPAGAGLCYAGFMLSRSGSPIRLGIEGLRQCSILSYLREAGYSRDTSRLSEFLNGLPQALECAVPVLAMDVGAEMHDSIGLEYVVSHADALLKNRAGVLLEHLTRTGLCTAAERDTLLAWTGEGNEWARRFFHAPERRFSHLKLVFRPAFDTIAKAYIELTCRPCVS